ncbi:NACHT domain-containing protein [Pseudoalteromonas sp. SCSIO 43210]
MAAKLEKRTVNPNFTDPVWYTSLIVDFLDLKLGSIAKTLAKGLNNETTNTASELVYMFIHAFNQCDSAKEYTRSHKTSYEALFFKFQLDPEFPTHHSLFHILLNELKQQKLNKNDFSLDDNWISELRQDFSTEFDELVRLERDKYKNACLYIDKLKHDTPIEAKVIQHTNDLIYEVEHEPLAIEHQLTLQKSYVSPNCVSQTVVVPKKDEAEQGEDVSNCLIKTVVNSIESKVQPIVIHGQPGHGKTSSVKMLARTMVGLYQNTEEPPIVLLFELKYLGALNRPIVDILHQRASFINDTTFFHGKKVVLIMDGLDERQATDGSSDQFLRDFITNLFDLSLDINKKQDSRLNLILTGRSQYVGQIQSCFNQTHTIIDICDFDRDKQQIWLDSFNIQKHLKGDSQLTLQKFERFNLADLVSQPILLTISSIMLTDADGKELIEEYGGQQINRAEIYRTIIKWSYEKRWHKGARVESWKNNLCFDDYFKLLQAIAFEMSRLGDETIKITTLVKALKENSKNIFDIDVINNMDNNSLEKLCSQLRISFFFQGVEEKAFSFIHKSIKDFLFVVGIVDASLIVFEDYNKRKPEKIDPELISLFGQKAITKEDHYEFLFQWIHLRKEKLSEYAESACDIWYRLAKSEITITSTNANIQLRILALTTFNFLQLVSRLFPILDEKVRVKLFNSELIPLFQKSSFVNIRNLLASQGLSHEFFAFQNLNGIEFDGAEYFDCDFSDSNIGGCKFRTTAFIRCDFTRIKDSKLNLVHTLFLNCKFDDIQRLHFNKGVMYPSLFKNCSFKNTYLHSAHESLGEVMFQDCKMETVSLRPNLKIKKQTRKEKHLKAFDAI